MIMKIGKATPSPPEPSRFAINHEAGKSLLSDRGNLWTLLVSLAFIILEIIVISLHFNNLPPEIPIFYSRTWGEAMIGPNIFIWIFPTMAVVFAVVNFVVYSVFFRNNKFLARILFMSTLLIGFTTFWGAMKIATLLV